jgi:DNA-binding SARP family transcriptional activator
VEFGILGPIEAIHHGQRLTLGHARLRTVLAVLLVEANRTTSVDQLMGRVWGDAPPQRGREVLYSYMSRLRRTIAADDVRIERHPGGYVLVVDEASIDLHRTLVSQARAATGTDRASTLFDDALLQDAEIHPDAGYVEPYVREDTADSVRIGSSGSRDGGCMLTRP